MSPCQAVEELGFSSFFSPHGFFVIFGIICVLGGPKFLAVKKKDSGLAGTHRTRVRTIRISKKKRRGHLKFCTENMCNLRSYVVITWFSVLELALGVRYNLILALRCQIFDFFFA